MGEGREEAPTTNDELIELHFFRHVYVTIPNLFVTPSFYENGSRRLFRHYHFHSAGICFFLAGSLGHQHRHLTLLASFTGADQNFLWPLGGLSGISGGVCEAGGLRSGELLGGGCWDVIGCRWKGCGRKASVYHSEGSVQRMKKEEGVGLRGGCRLELVCVSGLLPTREAEI